MSTFHLFVGAKICSESHSCFLCVKVLADNLRLISEAAQQVVVRQRFLRTEKFADQRRWYDRVSVLSRRAGQSECGCKFDRAAFQSDTFKQGSKRVIDCGKSL